MPWRSFKLLMPHRMRRRLRSKLRSRISPATSIASLQTSFSPKDTLRSLQSYRWSVYDFQYLLLAIIGIFSLCMIQSADPFGKTFVASALLLSLLLPITRQFFLPFLPIAAWLIFFYACQYVSYRNSTGTTQLTVIGSFPPNIAPVFGFASYRLWKTSYMAPTSATSFPHIRVWCLTYLRGFLMDSATTEHHLCARLSCLSLGHPGQSRCLPKHSATSV